MQRLFSTFANGWPGRGLLLQRLVTAIVLFHCAIASIGAVTPLALIVLHITAAAAGALLLVGLWTPVGGIIVAITEAGILALHPSDLWISIMLLAASASLALIGPGAWSIDALLFGRKHIEIPGR